MAEHNPYEAPQASLRTELDSELTARLKEMASGQKLVVYAVVVYFVAAASRLAIGPLAFVLFFGSLVMSLIGLHRVLSARQSHVVIRILLLILMFVPLVNLVVLLSINSRTTKTLRENGYKVGLMGASKPAASA